MSQVKSVQPSWALGLSIQQQSVLFLAARGPDGIPKTHPCKEIQRAYRGTVLVAARYGRPLRWGESGDTFMSMDLISIDVGWELAVRAYLEAVDEMPHHFHMHLLHGAQILGYKHPDERVRRRWADFYARCCRDAHMVEESEAEMDVRLGDWDRADWEP